MKTHISDQINKIEDKRLTQKPKKHLLPIFSPDFTLNGQIWLFYAEKCILSKSLVLCFIKAITKFT